MGIRLIVLNGASSSGKSTLARSLQWMLPAPWLVFGIDDLIEAVPDRGLEDGSLLHLTENGHVNVGPGWRQLETSWYVGIAAMAASGLGVIVDDVFLDGAGNQERLRATFGGLGVLWVGVKCDVSVAAAREATRPDRIPGMAETQAAIVHEGVDYDVVVDTTNTSSEACAALILSHLSNEA